jgi:hypothetical protein
MLPQSTVDTHNAGAGPVFYNSVTGEFERGELW